jgi:hypothetical protein
MKSFFLFFALLTCAESHAQCKVHYSAVLNTELGASIGAFISQTHGSGWSSKSVALPGGGMHGSLYFRRIGIYVGADAYPVKLYTDKNFNELSYKYFNDVADTNKKIGFNATAIRIPLMALFRATRKVNIGIGGEYRYMIVSQGKILSNTNEVFNSSSAGVVFHAGFQCLPRMKIACNYSQGLTNFNKTGMLGDWKQNTFSVCASYLFTSKIKMSVPTWLNWMAPITAHFKSRQ